MLAQRLPELFDEFGIRLRRSNKRFFGPCPIHDGGAVEGFSIYPDGYEAKGNWKCRSGSCEKEFMRTAVGFVRGMLSNQRYGWPDKNRKATTKEAVDFILDFLGITEDDVKVDYGRVNRQRVTSDSEFWSRGKLEEAKPLFQRDKLRKFMTVPSPYFLARGYSPQILDTYDVGTYFKRGSKLYGRVVVPVYDEKGKGIGVVTRSVHPQCNGCRLFHNPTSPCPSSGGERAAAVRWRANDTFNDKMHVYNLWRSVPFIRESETIIICEGAADVWRLEEAGIRNSIAIFGSDLSDTQDSQIQHLMIKRIIVASDMDESGDKLWRQISTQCLTYVNDIDRVPLPAKDIGEMTVEQVRSTFKPFLN